MALQVTLDGVVVARVRYADSSLRETNGPAANKGQLVFDAQPIEGQQIRITLEDESPAHVLFAGQVQAVSLSYDGRTFPRYDATLIDETFLLNARRPFGTWVDISASSVALEVLATNGPDVNVSGVAISPALPLISISADGSEPLMTFLQRIAGMISGRARLDYDNVFHLSLLDDGVSPDPIDAAHPPLDNPKIAISADISQARTRLLGKGHGEALLSDVAIGETILPIADEIMFNAGGGEAVAGTTPEGAQSQRMTYAGVQAASGGTLVGPGAAPSVAPSLALAAGSGLGAGLYGYAYTDVTGSGESLPSPLGTVTTKSQINPPSGTPNIGEYFVSGGLGAGTYDLCYVYSTDAAFAFPTHQTARSAFATVVIPNSDCQFIDVVASTDAMVTNIGVYRRVNGAGDAAWYYVNGSANVSQRLVAANNVSGPYTIADTIGAFQQVSVSGIATGPSAVTSRKVYRTAVGGTQLKLLTTLANNTATTYADSTADGSLGANAPTSDTSGLTQPTGQVNAGATQLPVASVAPFQAIGGWALLGSGQTVRYASIGGYYAPPSPMVLALVGGAGVSVGTYQYAYTDLTAAGESLPSPLATITTTPGNQQVSLNGVAIGPTGTLTRNVYRTVVGGGQLKLLSNLGNNSSTFLFNDATPDGSLGANAPTVDTSGLNRSVLTGIPASGPGAITTTAIYGSQVLPAPALTGINAGLSPAGIQVALAKGSTVAIFVQRDDLAAQTALAALEKKANGTATDGVREDHFFDGRLSEAELIAACDARLAQFSRPIVSTAYATRDRKTRAGATVSINLTTFGSPADFTIQDVSITFQGRGAAVFPRYTVRASSVAFTLPDLIRLTQLTRP